MNEIHVEQVGHGRSPEVAMVWLCFLTITRTNLDRYEPNLEYGFT